MRTAAGAGAEGGMKEAEVHGNPAAAPRLATPTPCQIDPPSTDLA